jgi:cell division protein FtsB
MAKSTTPFLKRLMFLMVSLVLLLLLVHALFGKRGYFELKKMKDQKENLDRQIEQLKSENKQILEEIKSLKTDPKAIEKIAREELGLVKPGEIKITTNKAEASDSPVNPSSKPASSPDKHP